MAFQSYHEHCDKFVMELERSISTDEIEQLRTVCKEIGETQWWEWCKRNRESILAYLRATPTERRNNKDWQETPYRLLLIFGSIQYAMFGLALLEHCEDIWTAIGETQRTMTVVAARSGFDMFFQAPRRWHFPGKDPFAQT